MTNILKLALFAMSKSNLIEKIPEINALKKPTTKQIISL